MSFKPVLFRWDAKERAMKVDPRSAALAARQFVDGEDYPLEVVEDRSSKEHNHYFAAIKNAWDNISDAETIALLGGPNGLRHWALIQTGWCDTTVIGPMTKAAATKGAQRAADNFRRWAEDTTSSKRRQGSYVEVVIRRAFDEKTGEESGWAVVIKTAKSQSRAAMKKEPFRESSRDVLEILSGTIQVKRRDLERSVM